jgi:multimeric flavodoxin WrbA
MQSVYPALTEADVVILSAPIFFYSLPSQAKALIDRCQALWCKRVLEKSPEERRQYNSGKGYLISVGATKGKNLFEGAELTAKYFYDALGMSYEGGVFARSIEGPEDVEKHADVLGQARDLGRNAAEN